MTDTLDGVDPLETNAVDGASLSLLEDANRRIVQNILKSYTGYFDVFNELTQNALDAVERRSKQVSDFEPKIWITIDLQNRIVGVTDNGVGMNAQELRFFVRPNVSFKQQKDSRGHKGVGASFLAYGFSALRVQTKQSSVRYSLMLRNGRIWTEDRTGSVPRPRYESIEFDSQELLSEDSGTSVQITLGNEPGVRPRDLGWLGAHTAETWAEILRIKTPVGGVYLTTSAFQPKVSLKVIDIDGTITHREMTKPEYFYPHEFSNFKSESISAIETELSKIQGGPDERFSKLGGQFKRLSCVYEVYEKSDLLKENSAFQSALTDDQRQLIERHQVSVYACFLASAKLWGVFNDDELKLRKGQRVISGGLQMASDNMVQGDLSVIPLTSEIGYQANSHVIVHLVDGNPDMGRKVFQPELHDLASTLAVRAVNTLKKYRQHLKPDTGATRIAPDKELHEFKKAQELYRDANPLIVSINGLHAGLISVPQQEQDVISLFHQLLGMNLLKGYKFFSTSQSERYDSLYFLDYQEGTDIGFHAEKNPLGCGAEFLPPYSSHPKVLEYKYDFDALIRDIDKEIKYAKHIDLVICWTADKQFRERYYLSSLLVGDEGATRENFGATHQAFPTGSNQPDFEVIILEDLIGFLRAPDQERARQKLKYDS